MPNSAMRASCGFVAGAISVLTFHQAMWQILHVLAVPGMAMPPAFPLDPVIPFGVPRILNYCFWCGLCGLAFGLVSPRLIGPAWLSGLALGIVVAMAGMLVGPTIKHFQLGARWLSLRQYTTMQTILMTYGLPVGDGVGAPLTWARSLLIDGSWGTGLGIILQLLIRQVKRRRPTGNVTLAGQF